MPDALAIKYPSQRFELGWQYLFPATKLLVYSRLGKIRQYHFDDSALNNEVKKAAPKTRIMKQVMSHTLRHSFMKYIPVLNPLSHPLDVQIYS